MMGKKLRFSNREHAGNRLVSFTANYENRFRA